MVQPVAERRRVVLVCALVASLCAILSASCTSTPRTAGTVSTRNARAMMARDQWVSDIGVFATSLAALDSATAAWVSDSSVESTAKVRRSFLDARLAFKHIEYLTNYYQPTTSKAMNGPALPHADFEEGPEVVTPPQGFQVIEELLYGDGTAEERAQASRETKNLRDLCTRLQTAAQNQRTSDSHVFDAAKLEVAVVTALGVTGFDSPVAKLSLAEAAAALQGVAVGLSPYRRDLSPLTSARLDSAFARAAASFDGNVRFDSFDRFDFIVRVANPLAQAIVAARDELAIGTPVERRAFRMNAVTMFDTNAFDPTAFAAPGTPEAPSSQIALGKALFFDPVLSDDGTRSCASCHDPARAFTDGRARSRSRSGHVTLRNAPTVLNAGLQVGTFYDLRTTYLEDQVADVIRNDEEMHGSIDAVATRLSHDAAYVARFVDAFATDAAGKQQRAIDAAQIRRAVASYIRSLTSLDSRVDRALRGQLGVLSDEERQGLNLFMGKAKCATCHFAPLFNGTVPPMHQESEVEVLGVPSMAVVRSARIDPDSGRFRVTRSAPHLHAFKTPSVRNVALTAPYMHNGVYTTLAQVVDFYNRGGGAGIGVRLPNQTLPSDTLGLSTSDQRAIVRFLEALTDTSLTRQQAPHR